LHRAGIVHRCLTPEHVIISDDGRATLIGLGNAALKSGPPPLYKTSVDEAFSAPETVNELSGRFNTPRADVYGFGLLASFAATAQRPTGSVHAPLTRVAAERLESQPEGVSLLIAKCLQPLQKNRIGSMRQILPLLEEVEALPTPTTAGFGPLIMLAPWFNDDDPGALRVGHLSPGPLVDRPKPAEAPKAEPAPPPEAKEAPPEIPAVPAPTIIEPVGLAPMSIAISALIAIATIIMVIRGLSAI
jgi:serine/threonine protein kinase